MTEEMTGEKAFKILDDWKTYYENLYKKTGKEDYKRKFEIFKKYSEELKTMKSVKNGTGWEEIKETFQSKVDSDKFADELAKSYKKREDREKLISGEQYINKLLNIASKIVDKTEKKL